MTRFPILLLFACLFFPPAAAQQRPPQSEIQGSATFSNAPAPPKEKTAAEIWLAAAKSACQRFCRERTPACVGKEPASDALCASQLFGCRMGCEACTAGEGACAKAAGEDSDTRCMNDFAACIKKEFVARLAPERLVRFGGGDGTSRETAVAIHTAGGEFEGVGAEYYWIALHFPKWERREQFHTRQDNRDYDGIVLQTPEGGRTVWFDITDFFGKPTPWLTIPGLGGKGAGQ